MRLCYSLKISALFISLFSSLSYAGNATLINQIGTGISLVLSNSDPKWDSFSIHYQSDGKVPGGWSAWNVKDKQGNYYGTITLVANPTRENPDGQSYKEYSPPTEQKYKLRDIKFSNPKTNTFQLNATVEGSKGPFPDAEIAKPAVYDGTQTRIILSVSENNIINDKKKPIILKGLARPSLEWDKQGNNLSENDIKNMATKWHANVIRIGLNQQFWEQDTRPKTEKGSYRQIIDAIIYYATKYKMAVILDLHWLDENSKQGPGMPNTKSIEFWKQVATEYKDFGTVIFELYNEPHNLPAVVWLKGDPSQNIAGHQTLVDAIRSTGANNICIVNGLDYGYSLHFLDIGNKDCTAERGDCHIRDKNIVYGSHPYTSGNGIAGGFKGDANFPKEWGGPFEYNFAGIKKGKYPLIFTEFGVNKSEYFTPREEYKSVYIKMMEEIKKYNGYLGFAWFVKNDDPAFPVLIKDWEGTPVNGGVLIHQDMTSAKGTYLFN